MFRLTKEVVDRYRFEVDLDPNVHFIAGSEQTTPKQHKRVLPQVFAENQANFLLASQQSQ